MNRLRYFFKEFIPEVISEMRKVTFPSMQEVRGTTLVVIITSFIFATYLWIADLIIVRLYQGLMDLTARMLS
jgi:preprotein translocase SecE subunit